MGHLLTIAGSDPSGQAGLQADLSVFQDLGHHSCSVITAVTAQNDERVFSVNPVETKILKDQLRALLEAYEFDAVKIGLLVTRELTYQVFRILEEAKVPNIVIDPVMRSSSGMTLLENAALPIFTGFLAPLARILTPNLDEAEQLTNLTVRTREQMATAAHKMMQESPGLEAVLVKGGHLEDEKIDVLFYNNEIYEFPTRRYFTGGARGTGCVLSSALACFLADGLPIPEATHKAKDYLEKFIPKRF